MGKSEIVRKFFEKGYLLSPEALEWLSARDWEKFLERDYEGVVITLDMLRQHSLEWNVIKNFSSVTREMELEDFIRFYRRKYEGIKSILVERFDKERFISISNLSSKGRRVSIIGMVKEKKARDGRIYLRVEDMTGSVDCILKQGDADIDDVLGFSGREGNGVLFVENVIYPDIPFREPKTGWGKFLFMSDLHFNEAPKEYIERLHEFMDRHPYPAFIAGDVGDIREVERIAERVPVFLIPGNADSQQYPSPPLKTSHENIISLSNPAMVEVNGLVVLMVHRFGKEMLKKRYLGGGYFKADEDMVISRVPDIVHFGHTHKPEVYNYKSTTIVNSGGLLDEFRPVLIDFSTREIRQMEVVL